MQNPPGRSSTMIAATITRKTKKPINNMSSDMSMTISAMLAGMFTWMCRLRFGTMWNATDLYMHIGTSRLFVAAGCSNAFLRKMARLDGLVSMLVNQGLGDDHASAAILRGLRDVTVKCRAVLTLAEAQKDRYK